MSKVQVPTFPEGSTARYVTVVSPTGNVEPETKSDVMVTSFEASVAVAATHVTAVPVLPKAVVSVISGGQNTSGSVVSTACVQEETPNVYKTWQTKCI